MYSFKPTPRFLSKLTDQMVALLSKEHARALILNDGVNDEDISEVDEDPSDDEDRMFAFEVQKTKEEEESLHLFPGFTVMWMFTVEKCIIANAVSFFSYSIR
jgi:hypothetical protein